MRKMDRAVALMYDFDSLSILYQFAAQLPREARHRVRSATRWTSHTMVDAQGQRCFVGHAMDYGLDRDDRGFLTPHYEEAIANLPGRHSAEIAFDHLADEIGLTAAVALVKDVVRAL